MVNVIWFFKGYQELREKKGYTANDLIEIPAGHANFLIRSGLAIEGTPDNIKQLELNKMKAQQEQEKHLKDMQELKVQVEEKVVKVAVKVGANGKIFGSVSTKEIVEAFKAQNNIELDKERLDIVNNVIKECIEKGILKSDEIMYQKIIGIIAISISGLLIPVAILLSILTKAYFFASYASLTYGTISRSKLSSFHSIIS